MADVRMEPWGSAVNRVCPAPSSTMSSMSDTPDPADFNGLLSDLAAGSEVDGLPPTSAESRSLVAPGIPGEQRRGSYGPTSGRTGGSGLSRRWVQRAEGDRRARARLQIIEGEGVVVLNDRRVPGSGSNIKWIAVSAAGVFVIDAKNYKGLVHIKRRGPISDLGPYELHVGRKNCTSSVESVNEQRARYTLRWIRRPGGSSAGVRHALPGEGGLGLRLGRRDR